MHDLEIRLFGGVEARSPSGGTIDLGPAKCRAVLAALALSAGSAVPVMRLVDLVWGTDPPRTAEKTLQTYVARLRRALGADSIVRSGSSYRLAIAAGAVDVNRFVEYLQAGETEAALREWTGHPLAGLEAAGLSAVIDGLVEQWLGAVEADLARQVDTDASAAIGALTELTAEHPLREGLWALRMTALYRAGRQADALAAYQTARRVLVEELGVEPGRRLRELEESILGQADVLPLDPATAPPATDHPSGTVVFGFSDVEGSTRLWATHRQEMAPAMARHDELVRAIASTHDGHVFASVGDTFGIAFHRVTDAVGWAIDLQAAMESEPWPAGIELRVRIGLHLGEAEPRGTGYFDPAVNIAHRIADAGHGGQTLLSGPVAAMLDRTEVVELGTFRLTGVAGELQLHQLGARNHDPLRGDGARGNLPRRLGRLVGRHNDLKTIEESLAVAPVVTLVGPGGIGKTRLAQAAAKMAEADLAGGAWFVELASITSSDDVARAVADTMSIPERPGEALTRSIVAALRSLDALLVLDNCEHVIDGAAELAQAVATGCPRVQVLATSREGLGIDGERLFAVPSLDPHDAGAELFNERALAADATFDIEGWRPSVEEICRRLDGMPLAIELAAARTRSLAPDQLIERLDDRFRLLIGGHRTSAARHRTLRATVQWSYDLLTPNEQRLFRHLSIFAGPFDLRAAERVAADRSLDVIDVDDLLGSLVDRSMIVVESGPRGRRFRLLETIRRFGAAHLEEDQENLIAARHAQWCLAEVTDIRELLSGQLEIEGVDRLAELWSNLRAAVHWSCATGEPRLAHDLLRPVVAEIYLRSQTEIGDWLERILAVAPPDDPELVLFGITWAARRYMRTLDRAGFERLVGRHGEPDDPLVRYARGFVYQDLETMAQAAPQAMDHLRAEGDRYATDLFELAGLGYVLLMTGQLEEHEVVMTALVERFRSQGPPTGLNWALTMLGFNSALRGDNHRAWRFFEESTSIDVPVRTHNMKNPLASRSALRRGDWRRAARILHGYVDELIENDNLYLARMMACADFVDMMLRMDRIEAAAHILGYLETTDRLDTDPIAALVTRSALQVSARSDDDIERSRRAGRELDELQALRYMRDGLDQLRRSTTL